MTVRLIFAQSIACGDSLSRERLCIDKVSAMCACGDCKVKISSVYGMW